MLTLELDDQSITPVTARMVERAIEQADRENAECLVLLLDTPGGLVDSTRVTVKAMLRSPVPVVVFVPTGGRAASAGLFVTLAGHVAAMAPGTHIGAAHPVTVGGLPISPPQEPGEARPEDAPPEAQKAVNDTAAWARALADLRARNADWAERAVRESSSATAEEALAEGVIDLVARDLRDLLTRVEGRAVGLPGGERVLRTRNAIVRSITPWWGERFLATISDPNIAFLLLLIGFYGILFELYSPGWGVAGTLGVIALVLAFFGLAILPINYVGLALIALALAMFVAEVFVTSFGMLALGGTACLVIGAMMLVDSPAGFMRVSLTVALPLAVATAGITLFLVGAIVRAQRSKVRVGTESMIGTEARADTDFARNGGAAYRGRVRTHGEIWRAECDSRVGAGEPVEIVERRGMTLRVRPSSHAREGREDTAFSKQE